MTHFEYISVAVALLFSFVVGRLLFSLAAVFEPGRAYWVHSLWVVQTLLGCFIAWWGFWLTRGTEWNAFRFAWALALPVLMFVRAHVLLGPELRPPQSARSHFYSNRVRFFAISVVLNVTSAVSPWVYGLDRIEWNPALAASILPLALAVAGLLFSSPRVHGFLAVAMAIATVAALFILPTVTPNTFSQ